MLVENLFLYFASYRRYGQFQHGDGMMSVIYIYIPIIKRYTFCDNALPVPHVFSRLITFIHFGRLGFILLANQNPVQLGRRIDSYMDERIF